VSLREELLREIKALDSSNDAALGRCGGSAPMKRIWAKRRFRLEKEKTSKPTNMGEKFAQIREKQNQ
jgi:hypothetical protein